jgi:hypothetical protein
MEKPMQRRVHGSSVVKKERDLRNRLIDSLVEQQKGRIDAFEMAPSKSNLYFL